ncbi:MAG: hypothetical protein F4Z15_04415, partial [Gammaproteobacteria bacterium]|nr:hypothetical protein [Gammaproteobacteria bacterium]MYD76135.1 hypothetical protein [Gammaproteobacteria bacterium]
MPVWSGNTVPVSENDTSATPDLEFRSSHEVSLSPERLWQAMTDPSILQACLKGCHDVKRLGNDEYSASFEIRLGPFRKRFVVHLKVIDSATTNRYRLEAAVDTDFGAGAEGSARVDLQCLADGGTRIRYVAHAVMHGWLARAGAGMLRRLVERQV